MKNILTLVDFTSTADIALSQAIIYAKRDNASVTVCHIADEPSEEVDEKVKNDLQSYADKLVEAGLDHHFLIGHGDLFDEVEAIVAQVRPDLILVGTHGKQGIRQNLFGSAIHKLVKHIPACTLVVNDHTRVAPEGYKKVMLPVAPHADYMIKVERTADLIAPGGEVVIFAILKPGVPLDDDIQRNVKATKEFLDSKGIRYSYVEEDSDRYSVGYSKETLAYVRDHGMDLISIMANVSDRNQLFGKMDKENVLLNDLGIPVLCANH